MGEAAEKHWLETVFESPYLWGVLTLIAIAFGFSPRDSSAGTWVCLAFALVTASAAVWFHPRVRAHARRVIFTISGTLFAAILLFPLGSWLTRPKGNSSPISPESSLPVPEPRIRIIDVAAIPMSANGASFPAINVYYDNAGTGVATGIVSHFGAGFGGMISDEQTLAEQDKLLRRDGWRDEMDRRKQHEMRPGDPGEFTSIPNMEGVLAEQFRDNWEKVSTGTTVLHVFVTFKYFNPSGETKVTEYCFWFSGGFARHTCGRARTFTEAK